MGRIGVGGEERFCKRGEGTYSNHPARRSLYPSRPSPSPSPGSQSRPRRRCHTPPHEPIRGSGRGQLGRVSGFGEEGWWRGMGLRG